MDVVTSINVVRDYLRDNLTDPYVTAGGKARGGAYWVFGDEPSTSSKFPQIQITKFDNTNEVIDIGSNYMEHEQAFLAIYFYTKNGFKVNINGTTYVNTQLAEYYLTQIKRLLKAGYSDLDDECARGYKWLNTTKVVYNPETQLYSGAVIIRVRWFQR
jgi:hypothetical protein